MRLRLVVGLAIFFCGNLFASDPTTAIYDTYLPASRLVPVLEPLLSPNDKITAYHNKLFVKALPSTQTEIKQVLDEIDRLPRNIQISLRYRERSLAQDNGNNPTITVYKGSSLRGNIEVEQVEPYRLSTDKGDHTQTLRLLEGTSARFSIGKEYPNQEWFFISALGAGFQTSTRQLNQDLMAKAIVTNGLIKLAIYTNNDQPTSNKTSPNKNSIEATVLLEPGLWTTLATNGSSEAHENSRQFSTRNNKELTIEVKAELLD